MPDPVQDSAPTYTLGGQNPEYQHAFRNDSRPDSYPGKTDYDYIIEKKVVAGLCGIFLGALGIHKFVMGFTSAGVIMLLISMSGFLVGVCLIFPIFALLIMGTIGAIEGLIYLMRSDADFYETYGVRRQEWF